MGIVPEIRAFYYAAKAGRHHGKAGKFLKRLDYQGALKHYQLAYEFYGCLEDDLGQAVELECIGRVHYRLNDFFQASQHAEKSLAIYQKYAEKDQNNVFSEAVSRVENLLVRLQK